MWFSRLEEWFKAFQRVWMGFKGVPGILQDFHGFSWGLQGHSKGFQEILVNYEGFWGCQESIRGNYKRFRVFQKISGETPWNGWSTLIRLKIPLNHAWNLLESSGNRFQTPESTWNPIKSLEMHWNPLNGLEGFEGVFRCFRSFQGISRAQGVSTSFHEVTLNLRGVLKRFQGVSGVFARGFMGAAGGCRKFPGSGRSFRGIPWDFSNVLGVSANLRSALRCSKNCEWVLGALQGCFSGCSRVF